MEPVSESTYWGLLAGAGALLYPSRYEGFGLPPLEAMSQSVPALVSEIPTARELYGGAARLLPAVAEHWAEAMADVMRGDIPDAALGREVAARYDWSNCARAYVRRYAALA
jgi:glycosyltransferase involved in cell wall biosynthesis